MREAESPREARAAKEEVGVPRPSAMRFLLASAAPVSLHSAHVTGLVPQSEA